MSIHTAMIKENLDQREGQPEPNSAGGTGGGAVVDVTPCVDWFYEGWRRINNAANYRGWGVNSTAKIGYRYQVARIRKTQHNE